MKKQQSGFTLIELVVVIVILGILAATALPKFVDLSGDAGDAAISGFIGALSSSSGINYAADLANGSAAAPVTVGAAADAAACRVIFNNLLQSDLPAATEVVVAGSMTCGTAGDSDSGCTLAHTSSSTAAKGVPLTCTE